MANEAVCIEAPKIIKKYTINDTDALAKGTVMGFYSGAAIIRASSGANAFAGITIEEKTASDGVTNIGVAKDGIWDIKAAGAVVQGTMVKLSGTNLIGAAVAADLLTGVIAGKAEEDAVDAEVIRINLLGI